MKEISQDGTHLQGARNLCFSPKILIILPPSPLPALGCYLPYSENVKPTGVTVHSHCFEYFEYMSPCAGKGRVAVDWDKTNFFLKTLTILRTGCSERIEKSPTSL